MSHAIVTVEVPAKERVDLALPLNIPNQVLAPALAQALDLPENGKGIYLLSVKTADGIIRLSGDVTLGDAGVLDGFILQLQQREVKTSGRGDVETRTFLQSESGEIFHLNTSKVVIGRKDVKRGLLVDLDLAPYDTGRVVSRRHAWIEKRGNGFFIIDLASTNGTKVNGKRLASREAHHLEDGDVIEFGRNGVKLTFIEKS